jgi:diacylglycerol kinase family enzyme
MDIILYNPKSRNGQQPRFVERLKKRLKKKHQAVVTKNMLEIDHVDAFLSELQKDDRLILVGGDGTLHRLVNTIDMQTITQPVFMVKGGTGNDFLRSLHAQSTLIPIKSHLLSLPKVVIQDKTMTFINGVGLGLDGLVGHIIDTEHAKKTSLSYLKATLKGFVKHKPSAMTFKVNGKTLNYNHVWMASVMFGHKFGGGMSIAPQAKRDEWLHVVIIKDCPKWLLFVIFPLIYIGKHVWFKKYVEIHPTKEVSIHSAIPLYGEVDGELLNEISTLHIKR